MADDSGIDRRTLLASLATVGGAGALGGAGSVAFFSDREEFANNRLVAGSLDLKLDWEEYYADWDTDQAAAVSDVRSAGPDEYLDDYPADYRGLPTPENALIAVPEEDVADFLDAAAVEAYPDADDDARVDYPTDGNEVVYDVCVHGADTPEDLDPAADPGTLDPTVDTAFKTEGTGLRTLGPDTVATDDEGAVTGIEPLIAVDDLKPGDFGEVTLSVHLCDNDGYLALTGEERFDRDRSLTEPERKDPDETDGLAGGELADAVRVALWYDGVETDDRGIDPSPAPSDPAGNNLLDDGETVIQEMSLSAFLAVAERAGIELVPPAADGTGAGQTAFVCAPEMGTLRQSGSAGVQPGQSFTVAGGESDTTVTITGVGTDADGNTTRFNFSVSGPETVAPGNFVGVCSLTIEGSDGSVTVEYGAGGCVRSSLFLPRHDQPSVGTVESVTFGLCTFQGVGEQEEPRCFVGSNTYYLGFAWWLPADHANELQTDAVAFDLGVRAEQCRHNDGPFQDLDLDLDLLGGD